MDESREYAEGRQHARERFTGETVGEFFAEASTAAQHATGAVRKSTHDYWQGYHDGIVAAAVERFDS